MFSVYICFEFENWKIILIFLFCPVLINYFLENAEIVRTTVDAMTQGDLSGLDMKVREMIMYEQYEEWSYGMIYE